MILVASHREDEWAIRLGEQTGNLPRRRSVHAARFGDDVADANARTRSRRSWNDVNNFSTNLRNRAERETESGIVSVRMMRTIR